MAEKQFIVPRSSFIVSLGWNALDSEARFA
jgi:hypothetical protein